MRILKYTGLFCLMATMQTVSAQTIITLDSILTDTQTKIARDAVIMNPGFIYTANTSSTFIAKTDKTVVGNQTYSGTTPNTSQEDILRTLDNAKTVGSINGNLSVSPNGSAIYQIPIDIPAGIDGLQPSIALTYNSMGKEGCIGIGWNISGTSAISRTGHTLYHDNIQSGIELSEADVISLDGTRIMWNDGLFDHIFECRENLKLEEDNGSIISCSDNGGFIVKTPDGKTLEYGTTADSRFSVMKDNVETIVSWKLSKVTDANGLVIQYKYITNANTGEIYLSSIEYSNKKINFLYSNRSDTWTGELLSSRISRTVLLEKIEITSNNTLLNTYELKYNHENGLSQLTEVTLFNKADESLNATLFKWNKPEYSVAYQMYDSRNNNDKFLSYVGDLDGDGIDEITHLITSEYNRESKPANACYLIPNENSSIAGTIDRKLALFKRGQLIDHVSDISLPRCDLYKNFDSRLAEFLPYLENQLAKDVMLTYKYYLKDISLLTIGDFDGDGTDEICIGVKNLYFIDKNDWEVISRELDESIMDGVALEDVGCTYKFYNSYDPLSNRYFGWGLDNHSWNLPWRCWDCVAQQTCDRTYAISPQYAYDNSSYFFYKIDQSGNLYPEKGFDEEGNPIPNFTIESTNTLASNGIDYNQDGKADFLQNDGQEGCELFSLNETGSGVVREEAGRLPLELIEMTPYDLNGDGILDYVNADSSEVLIMQMTENAIDSKQFVSLDCKIAGITDINNDNTSEIICAYPRGNGYDVYVKSLSQINETNKYMSYIGYICGLFINTSIDDLRYNSIDVNGDGWQDLIESSKVASSNEAQYRVNRIWINNKNGGYYCNVINEDELVYDKYTNPMSIGDFDGDGNKDIVTGIQDSFQYISFNQGMPDHHISEIIDGMNNRSQISYAPLTDTTVYEKESSSNPVYPLASITTPMYVVNEVKSSTGLKDDSNNEIWHTTEYNYKNMLIHQQGLGLLGFEKVIELSPDENIQKIRTYEVMPDFYTMALQKTEVNKLDGSPIESTVYSNETDNLGNKCYRQYVSGKVQTNHLTGATITSNYQYDGATGNLIESTTQYGSDASETTHFTYTSIGGNGNFFNVSEILNTSICGASSFSRKKDFSYDSNGNMTQEIAFANTDKPVTTTYSDFYLGKPQKVEVSATGVSSPKTEYTYNNIGLITEAKNPANQVSKFTYDPATDLITSNTDNLGNKTKYTYNAWGEITGITSATGAIESRQTTWAASDQDKPQAALYKKEATGEGKTPVTTYYDSKERVLRIISLNALGNKVYNDTKYDEEGRIVSKSEPYFGGATPQWDSYTYDDYGRKITATSPVSELSISYNGLTTTGIMNGRTQSKKVNAKGDVVQATDAMGNTVTYTYHASGQPMQITTAGVSTTMSYDAKGLQTSLTDADAGTTGYEYDALGRLIKQTDARGKQIELSYDNAGRLWTKNCSSDNISTSYTYNATGQLSMVNYSQPEGIHKREFTYDSYGRTLTQKDYLTATESYTKTLEYDKCNRITRYTYPSGYSVKYDYSTSNGNMTTINKADNSPIWQLMGLNNRGQVTQYKQGNKLTTTNTYSTNGYLTRQQTGTNVQDLGYEWVESTGNLAGRWDDITGQYENFQYDNLDRLKIILPNSEPNIEMNYAGNGNILSKTDVGSYNYTEAFHPHAVNGITENAGSIPTLTQTINYNAFNKVSSISEGNYNYSIRYNVDNQRLESKLYYNGTLNKTKKYLGNYEIIAAGSSTTKINYIFAPTGLTAVVVNKGVDDNLYYACTDHLGSLTALTDEAGNVSERYSYDAWGRQRDPSNWTLSTNDTGILDRSYEYTGHETLPEFNLINMNGRVYDPLLGRMLSSDNQVQDPFNSQNYNRYTYCLNNPLKYIDPTGMSYDYGDWHETEEREDCIYESRGFIERDDNTGQAIGVGVEGRTNWDLSSNNEGRDNWDRDNWDNRDDDNSHYGSDGSFNLYTPAETRAVMNFYASIAGGEILGATIGWIQASGIIEQVASKIGSWVVAATQGSISAATQTVTTLTTVSPTTFQIGAQVVGGIGYGVFNAVNTPTAPELISPTVSPYFDYWAQMVQFSYVGYKLWDQSQQK